MDFLAQWKLFSESTLHSPTRQPAIARRQHALKALSRQQSADCPLLLLAGAVHFMTAARATWVESALLAVWAIAH